ncbi:unnamed protein product, partial [Ilex paraguariensis]
AGKGGDLTHDETTIIAGALELTEKTAKDAMTPISKAFSLDLDGTLTLWVYGLFSFSVANYAFCFMLQLFNLPLFLYSCYHRETLNAIMTIGHSRVPVYSGNPTNIIGLILVKNLLTVDPEDAVPLRKMMIRKIPRVSEDMPLYDILNEFQKGHSHIAVVFKDLNERKDTPQKTKEDTQNVGIKTDSQDADTAVIKTDGDKPLMKSPSTTPSFKKRHRGCSFCVLDLENAPVPDIPPDQEAVGVITMEDVIEELLQVQSRNLNSSICTQNHDKHTWDSYTCLEVIIGPSLLYSYLHKYH